jgi:hypothetical protein
MNIQEVITALELVKAEFERKLHTANIAIPDWGNEYLTNGGYYRVGNVCIKISEVMELK